MVCGGHDRNHLKLKEEWDRVVMIEINKTKEGDKMWLWLSKSPKIEVRTGRDHDYCNHLKLKEGLDVVAMTEIT